MLNISTNNLWRTNMEFVIVHSSKQEGKEITKVTNNEEKRNVEEHNQLRRKQVCKAKQSRRRQEMTKKATNYEERKKITNKAKK